MPERSRDKDDVDRRSEKGRVTEATSSGDAIMIPTSLGDAKKLLGNPGLVGDLVRGSMGSLIVKVANIAGKFAASVLLARLLGATEYGQYAFAFTVVTLLAIPTQLGIPNLLVRYVAQYDVQKEWGLLKGILKRANQVVFLVSCLLVGGLAIATNEMYGGFKSGKAETLLWAAALIPLLSLGELRNSGLRGLRYVTLGLLPDKVIRWVGLAGVLAIYAAFIDASPSAPEAMAIHVGAAFIAFSIGTYWLVRRIPEPAKNATAKFDTRKWVSIALPFLLTGGMQILNNRLDILVISWFRPDDQVGIYDVSVQMSMLVGLGLSATNMLVGPYFSRFYSEGNIQRLQKVASAAVIFSIVLSIVPFVTLVAFGAPTLAFIFGSEFSEGATALGLLSFGQLSHVGAGSVGLLLNMTGREWLVFRGVAVATTCNLALNIGLVPLYGITGAAIATATTFLIWNAILVYWACTELDVDPSVIGLFRST